MVKWSLSRTMKLSMCWLTQFYLLLWLQLHGTQRHFPNRQIAAKQGDLDHPPALILHKSHSLTKLVNYITVCQLSQSTWDGAASSSLSGEEQHSVAVTARPSAFEGSSHSLAAWIITELNTQVLSLSKQLLALFNPSILLQGREDERDHWEVS